jgi:hypothetical protein
MGFLKRGKEVELAFSKILTNTNFSSKDEDINEHWDLSTEIKFDVKGLKKKQRFNSEPNESIHWVELKNVNGKLGWLYGDADYFVFELVNYWVIVDKLDLQEYIKTHTIKEFCDEPTKNKLYSRKDRKDVLTLISTFDLIYISTSMIRK